MLLELHFTKEFFESLDQRFLALQRDAVRDSPFERDWFVRAVVRLEDGAVIGHCGFHRPPDDAGSAEIGYNILPRYRGNSFATEAASGLVAWALQQGSFMVIAAIAPENRASRRVAEKAGFHQTGERIDSHDGNESLMYLFEHAVGREGTPPNLSAS
jgi:RimJ/RimL family protein N-acetyltransferase